MRPEDGDLSDTLPRDRCQTACMTRPSRVGALVRRGDLLYNLDSPVDEAGLGLA